MASSPSPRNWEYNVFTSFHGPDVRKTFLSHLRKQFIYNGITMFDDNKIERSETIGPALIKAIRESRIAIVLLSKNYASSRWCLDELLEILKCKEELGQIVMTVFYEVDPSDVRKQTGEFGSVFDKTCARKTEDESAPNAEEQRRKWSQALTYVGNIAGEDFKNWVNEAEMVEKIARDISGKINATPCRDFDDMVGLDDHLSEMESLLDTDNVGVKIVGISGPAGIGKSTIARALHSRLSSKFQHSCFVDNLRETCKISLDEHGLKLRLHEQLFSKLLKQNGMEISHLGVIKLRLHDKKVLVILDDVESLVQLKVLADITWFSPGSRVIVTTENKKILQQHGISDIYHVDFPSESKALMIFCLSAFKQTSPPTRFMDLAYEVVRICGNLPLALCVLGSSLRGKSHADWIDEIPMLRNSLDGSIEKVLKVGYESLHEKEKSLFLYIAVFLNYRHTDHVTSMLEKCCLNGKPGLKILADKNLTHIDQKQVVVMHRLLQVMAIEVINNQESTKRHILVDAQEISYILEDATGNGSTKGVSFDVAEIDELKISATAFERMCNLLFLKVYNVGCHTGKRKLHIPVDIQFPSRIRLFHWDAYPGKSLPRGFCAKNLVEVNMEYSELEKLWEGTQSLGVLKKMNLFGSSCLRELPDLSKATNLERLGVGFCNALVEIPSAVANLHRINTLWLAFCSNLEVIPSLINLTSLELIDISGCLRLRSFPDMPNHIEGISADNTGIEELPASFRHCSRLDSVKLWRCVNLKSFETHLPTSVTEIHLDDSGIERITDSIKGLHNLIELHVLRCKRLVSLPELPSSLKWLLAYNCTSLERVSGPLNTPNARLNFTNCIKLGRQARRTIIQGLFVKSVLPGRKVPKEFDYRARGKSLTIDGSAFNRFKVCIVMSPNQDDYCERVEVLCRWRVVGNTVKSGDITINIDYFSLLEQEHLIISDVSLPLMDPSKMSRNIAFKFSSKHNDFNIIECGVKIFTDETEGNNNGNEDDLWDTDESDNEEDQDHDSVANWTSESESGEEDDDSIANGRFDSGSSEVSYKEDDEESYKSESGEASEEEDEDMADEDDEYESLSRKRSRTTMNSIGETKYEYES